MNRSIHLLLLSIVCYNLGFSQNRDSSARITKETFRYDLNVEIEAGFPGGELAWNKYLEKNINVNIPEQKGAKKGEYKITIDFSIDKMGSTTNLKANTNFGFGMEDELIRVIKNSPRWSPGIQKGKPLDVNRRQSFTFIISGED